MTLVEVDDCRYDCEIGEFYRIFAHNPRSWEFRSNGTLKEGELSEALEVLRMLNGGQTPDHR